MQNNLFVKWFVEMIQRLFKKSPTFFKVWQTITGFAAAITGLPELLTAAGIHLPPAAMAVENKVIAYISIGLFFSALLPTQSNINSISPQGVPNLQVNPKAMPFTLTMDLKKAVKDGKPVEKDPNAKS